MVEAIEESLEMVDSLERSTHRASREPMMGDSFVEDQWRVGGAQSVSLSRSCLCAFGYCGRLRLKLGASDWMEGVDAKHAAFATCRQMFWETFQRRNIFEHYST